MRCEIPIIIILLKKYLIYPVKKNVSTIVLWIVVMIIKHDSVFFCYRVSLKFLYVLVVAKWNLKATYSPLVDVAKKNLLMD